MITTHKLDFEVAEHNINIDSNYNWMKFKVGTCYGLWSCSENSYNILAIKNSNKGNGHLLDVFEWFEFSCKRDKKTLIIMEVWNKRFKKYLIKKKGFKDCGLDVEKSYSAIKQREETKNITHG